MARDDDYVLGVDPDELARLRFQHATWAASMAGICRRAGFGVGDRLLDLGCGPGYTTLELARQVGPSGQVVARDRSAAFVEHLVAERDRAGLPWIEPSVGPIEELELPEASLDGAYSRWLFSWPARPELGLARVAAGLKPGARLAAQEYLVWGATTLVPRSDAYDRVIELCLESFRRAGGHIDIGERLGELGRAHGLEVESFEPVARSGRAGSMEWRWPTGFLRAYVPKLVAQGLATGAEHAAFVRDLDEREAEGSSWLVAPVMVDAVLRRR